MQQLRQRLLHFLSVLKSTIESAATILQSYVVITCKWLRILPALCLISFESELKHTWPSLSEAPFCPSWWWWCTWWVPAAYLVGPRYLYCPTVIVYSPWPYDRILSEGELFVDGTTMHQMKWGRQYSQTIAISDSGSCNRTVNTHHRHPALPCPA